ncbi:MAG: alpha/beta hydrolase [Desulfovibrio sp.]
MSTLFAVSKWSIGILAALWLGVATWLALFQSRLVYQPTREVQSTPADVGLAYERLLLRSNSGARIEAWYIPAFPEHLPGVDSGPGGRGSVLFCHGNGGNLGHRLETALILHRLGVNVLLFDYQGYGNSEGSPSESGTYADARACWDWLQQERGETAQRLVLMGRSLGGAVAAQLAEQVRSAGLVLESTFTSIPDMGARLYPFLPVRLLSRFSYDTLARLPGLERNQIPILVIHSPDDDIVPFALGRELYDRYNGPKEFVEITGGHNEGFLLSGTVYDDALDRFFSDVLGSARGSARGSS